MNFKERLLSRLDEIGRSLRDSGNALALLGLGSCGQETDRLDDYSDLDFFAIVDNGSKWRFINSLDWLERVGPIAYALRNTADGYKLMFEDGIFCEFAVFEPHEMANIPFAPGRVVWQQPWFDARCCEPKIDRASEPSRDIHWLVGVLLVFCINWPACTGRRLAAPCRVLPGRRVRLGRRLWGNV